MHTSIKLTHVLQIIQVSALSSVRGALIGRAEGRADREAECWERVGRGAADEQRHCCKVL